MFTMRKRIFGWAMAGAVLIAALDSQVLFAAPTLPWLAEFQQALRAAWVRPDISMHGKVRFVAGNDVRLPGRQFRNGRNWLALACTVQGCRLEPAALSVEDESGKGSPGADTAQHLRFDLLAPSNAKAIGWFDTSRAPTWLKPGDVATYHPGIGRPEETGKGTLEARISLPGGQAATLVPMLLADADEDDTSPPVLLQLRASGQRQMLLGQLGLCTHRVDAESYLLWAGDLDGDGKPDYLISFVDLDGPVHLYLSSEAKAGQLVGLAGVYNAPPSERECDGGGSTTGA